MTSIVKVILEDGLKKLESIIKERANGLQSVAEHYKQLYPEYTLQSIVDSLTELQEANVSLNAITLDYLLKPKNLGGLAYGETYSRNPKNIIEDLNNGGKNETNQPEEHKRIACP